MKKSLLATTAIAALGAVAVASPASAKFEVGVSGYMEQWFGYSDNSDGARVNSDVFDQINDSEFNVTFKQTLDNGITIGGEIQIEGQQQAEAVGDEVDESYAYIDGAFGRIVIGNENGAGYLMHYGLPSQGIGIDESDTSSWVAGATGTLRITSATTFIDNDQNKITYFSPRVSGFQVGASYQPNADDINAITPGTAGQESDGSRDNAFSVGANYQGSFNDVSLMASVGYADGGNDNAVVGNESALSAGLRIGMGGFTAAFAYGEFETDDVPAGAATGSDINTFGVTVGYKAGPVGVSIGYLRGENSDTNDEQDNFELGASYAMGPGVTAAGSIYYVERDTNGNSAADGIAVVGGLRLSF
jgi:outer membrane protein OmpU